MSKVRVAGFGVSIDGFGAGPDQSLENPLGIDGPELHNWFYPTRTFRSMLGKADGTEPWLSGDGRGPNGAGDPPRADALTVESGRGD